VLSVWHPPVSAHCVHEQFQSASSKHRRIDREAMGGVSGEREVRASHMRREERPISVVRGRVLSLSSSNVSAKETSET
jgi:hypothetical protein